MILVTLYFIAHLFNKKGWRTTSNPPQIHSLESLNLGKLEKLEINLPNFRRT